MTDIPIDILATHANSYASANGIQVERRRKEGNNDDDETTYFECAPMSLLPNAYPNAAFDQAVSVAPHFNELVDRVSRDEEFLTECLGGGVSDMDPYTANLLKLYKQVYCGESKSVTAVSADRLGIHRSDYMLHRNSEKEPYRLKQVELNTIAASFAGLSTKISKLHKYLSERFESDVSDFFVMNQKIVSGGEAEAAETTTGVPENPALEEIPLAMHVARERYAAKHGSKDSVVLFVVQEGETNTVDQRILEFRLWTDYKIPVVRMSLTKLATEMTLDETTGALKVGSSEVAMVYFRAGYAPTDYPDGDNGIEWKARLTLEKSRAAKCPSLGYHLAGTKKVQQELARPGVLERFFPAPESKDAVEKMRACFAGLYSLGEDAGPEDIAAAEAVLDGQQGQYVLKPQREGGGYNFYGDELAAKLKENVKRNADGSPKLSEKLGEFILMQRLFPPQQRAVLLRGGKVEGSGDSISELGCFGTLVVDGEGTVVHNNYAGFLLRTKFSNVDEGGVASGFATLSSPYLC